jgi:hypothetical protein
MTKDNLETPYYGLKWQIGKLSIELHADEDILALAQFFSQTEGFLIAIEDILERVDVVFGLQSCILDDDYASFLDPPPHESEVADITDSLTAVYLAWQIARDSNPAIASFKIDTLENLWKEIHQVNRDAIDAACNGTEDQKSQAAFVSRKGIELAHYKMNKQLCIHLEKFAQTTRDSNEKRDSQIPAEVAQDPPPPFLAQTVSGTPEQNNPPIRWSNYRQPQEWRRLRKLKGLSKSVNIWPDLLRAHPNDIQCESTKSARISFELADSWGLDLPEFKT